MWLAFTDDLHLANQSFAKQLLQLMRRNWGDFTLSTAVGVGMPSYTLSSNRSLLLHVPAARASRRSRSHEISRP